MVILNYTGSPGEKIPQKVLGGLLFWLTLYCDNAFFRAAWNASAD